MTEGPIGQQLIRFALPLFLGNLFQQLYNIADTLIVGNLLGSTALAAVSSTGSLVFLLISLFSGVAMGAGVVISRYFGAGDVPRMRRAMTPMVVMLVFWCVIRVGFLTVVAPLVQSMAAVNWVYPLTWSLSSITLLIYYHKADWLHGFETREHRAG